MPCLFTGQLFATPSISSPHTSFEHTRHKLVTPSYPHLNREAEGLSGYAHYATSRRRSLRKERSCVPVSTPRRDTTTLELYYHPLTCFIFKYMTRVL